MAVKLEAGTALLVVDVQNDFLPGGALAVRAGDAVIPALNRYLSIARRRNIPVYASRDWHPLNHCSFTDYCVLNTVRDALADGFEVTVLRDAIAAVNVHPDDGPRAEEEMQRLGACFATHGEFDHESTDQPAAH